MSDLIITRRQKSPIRIEDVSPEWAMEAMDQLSNNIDLTQAHVDLTYQTSSGQKTVRVMRIDVLDVEVSL